MCCDYVDCACRIYRIGSEHHHPYTPNADLQPRVQKSVHITEFNFETDAADPDRLIAAWLPEIETTAQTYVPDDRFISFLTAALRLGARSKSLKNFNLMDVIVKAGYSRSTFFRLFEGYTGFLLQGYQLTCQLSGKVFAKHLEDHAMNIDEFSRFTADVFYGGNCAIPNEIVQMLWKEHQLTQAEFHPHLNELTSIIYDYLTKNESTKHLTVDQEELHSVIQNLDLDMLNARLEDNPTWGTPTHYSKLRRLFHGYLLTLS